MLLLWSLLNVVVLLGLLYIFGRAALLVKRHMGLGAALFFCGGLLAIGGQSGPAANNLPAANLLGSLPPGTPLGNASSLQTIPLGSGFSKMQLLAEYWVQQGAPKPRGLYFTVAGFLLGHRWQPLTGMLVPQGSRLRYTAVVRHEWTLLGSPVFSSQDEYIGLMPAAG